MKRGIFLAISFVLANACGDINSDIQDSNYGGTGVDSPVDSWAFGKMTFEMVSPSRILKYFRLNGYEFVGGYQVERFESGQSYSNDMDFVQTVELVPIAANVPGLEVYGPEQHFLDEIDGSAIIESTTGHELELVGANGLIPSPICAVGLTFNRFGVGFNVCTIQLREKAYQVIQKVAHVVRIKNVNFNIVVTTTVLSSEEAHRGARTVGDLSRAANLPFFSMRPLASDWDVNGSGGPTPPGGAAPGAHQPGSGLNFGTPIPGGANAN